MTATARLGHCGGMDLALRFTEAETSLSRPDLAAFAAVDHALLREQQADHDDTSPLGDLLAASIVASQLRLVDDEPARAQAPVFVRQRHCPIPAISTTVTTSHASPVIETPDAGDFVLDGHAHGHFAWPQRRTSRTGAALVLAACIPMFMPDIAAAQAASVRQPAPVVVPPSPAPVPAPVVVTPPTPAVPRPAAAPTATPPGVPNLQSILVAMRGHEAVVFAAGRMMTGMLIGVEGDFVMMVDDARDGKIAMIPKSQITEVRGKVERPRREGPLLPDGMPQLAGGGVLVAIGGPLTISGLVFVSLAPSSAVLWGPQLIPGLLMAGGGIALLVSGTRKRRAFRDAIYKDNLASRLTPSVGRTQGGGWTGGLRLRF